MQISFSASTKPTSYDADSIVENIAADLDGIAQASGYTVPVTGTQAKALMKRYNILGAACECWHSGYRSDAQLPPNASYWCDSYKAFVDRLRKGQQQLPGLDPVSDIDPVFTVVHFPQRDEYFSTREDTD